LTSLDSARGKPILTAHLLPIVEARLIELLKSLRASDWKTATIAPGWKVKDVASHLLDTQLRKLSIVRDGYLPGPPPPIKSHADLVALVNRLNREGVEKYRPLSPAVLIALMEVASREHAAFHQSLDPMELAEFGVSWAGETQSPNWFDTARELTERWHHQQQIRLATNKPGIMTRELYHPVLDCFMRALPFTYRTITADAGAHLRFNVSGDCGGSWYLVRQENGWRLIDTPEGRELSETTIPQEIAWRIFTKGLDRQSARSQVTVRGDEALGGHVLSMISIIG